MLRLNKATTEKYLATSFNEIKLLLVSREWKTIPYTEEVSRILSFYDYDIQVDPATGKLLKVFKAQRFSPDQQAILDKAKLILKGDKKQ